MSLSFWIIRILSTLSMTAATAYFLDGKIELGDFCILIGMWLILNELTDISESLRSK